MKNKLFIYFFMFIVLIFLIALNYLILTILFNAKDVTYLIVTNLLVPIEIFLLRNKIDKFIRRVI